MYVVVDCDGALIWMGIKQKQKKKKKVVIIVIK